MLRRMQARLNEGTRERDAQEDRDGAWQEALEQLARRQAELERLSRRMAERAGGTCR